MACELHLAADSKLSPVVSLVTTISAHTVGSPLAPAALSSLGLGAKALTLHRLACSGLPIPPAIVLPWELALEIESGLAVALTYLRDSTQHIRYPLAVRSSGNIEDRKSGAAPGLFESVLDVNSETELLAAIAEVLQSTRTPLVRAYLEARELDTSPSLAVIVQEQIKSTIASGVLYTRSPGRPDSDVAIVEVAKLPPIWIDRSRGQTRVPKGADKIASLVPTLWKLAQEMEKLLACPQGLDIEWVWDERGPWIVQARPVVHRSGQADTSSPEVQSLIAFSLGDMDTLWKLDATHNPFPCSPAQAGLVELMRPLAPYNMRIVGGYLYTAKRQSPDGPSGSGNLAGDTSNNLAGDTSDNLTNTISDNLTGDISNSPTSDTSDNLTGDISDSLTGNIDEDEVRRHCRDRLFPKMHSALSLCESRLSPSLSEAIKTYREVFQCYTEELAPLLNLLGETDSGGNPLTVWLERAKRGDISLDQLMEAVAPMAPAWDVCVPTYRETPELVEAAIQLTRDTGEESELSMRESDDLFFFRAQAQVRHALQALAKRWQMADDIFFLPLSEVLAEEKRATPLAQWRAQAACARTTHQQSLEIEMPLAFINGEVVPTRLPALAELWSGVGTGASVRGTVVRVQNLRSFPRISSQDNTVLVMPALSPAHALAARGVVAIVCEYGDHLGHGAAMARELQIPCIVGCKRAWRELHTGDTVLVHGQAGLVARTARADES